MVDKLKEFFKRNEVKIALLTGFLLVAAISFEFGLIQGKKSQISPLVIEKAARAQDLGTQVAPASAPEASKTAPDAKISPASAKTPPADCAFVGSKNSNKAYAPACHFAKLVKPENLVCFKSADEAQAQGRQLNTECVK